MCFLSVEHIIEYIHKVLFCVPVWWDVLWFQGLPALLNMSQFLFSVVCYEPHITLPAYTVQHWLSGAKLSMERIICVSSCAGYSLVLFVAGGSCIFVSTCTLCLCLQIIAIKSSFVLDWISPHLRCLFGGSKSFDNPLSLTSHLLPPIWLKILKYGSGPYSDFLV